MSEEDSYEMCSLMKSLKIKFDEKKLNTSAEASVLEGSFVTEGTFTNHEWESIAEHWADIEDDPFIIDHEVDEAIQEMNNVLTTNEAGNYDDDDEPEQFYNNGEPLENPPLVQDVNAALSLVRKYFNHYDFPLGFCQNLDTFDREIRNHRMSLPKSSPSITSFFQRKQ